MCLTICWRRAAVIWIAPGGIQWNCRPWPEFQHYESSGWINQSYVKDRAKPLEKLKKLKSNTASELTQLHLSSVNDLLGPHSSITHVTSVNLTVNLKQQTWTLFATLKKLAKCIIWMEQKHKRCMRMYQVDPGGRSWYYHVHRHETSTKTKVKKLMHFASFLTHLLQRRLRDPKKRDHYGLRPW